MSVFGGVAEFSCGRDVFFPKTLGFLLVLTRVGAAQILTNQKVQNLKKEKTAFYPKLGVNDGILKNWKDTQETLDFFRRKVGFCSGSFH